MKKTVTILGSTGSIGKNTVSLVVDNPDKFEVVALVAKSNISLLAEQAKILKPQYVAIGDETKIAELKQLIPDVKIISVLEAAGIYADITIAAIVGFAGLESTFEAVKRGGRIGLANKESLVCGGSFILAEAKKSGAEIMPIDSEHNAVFQVLDNKTPDSIEKITLTASGGPFLNFSSAELKNVTPQQALKHPKWKMGAKISIDSATMMNKGLELIEAKYLFGVTSAKLDVVIHPESIIHSTVSYNDGAVLAQLSNPDMRVPISYVLAFPMRLTNSTQRLDLAKIASLNFFKPDTKKFLCLNLAMQVLDADLSTHIALNAANEVAVAAFLAEKINFTQIPQMVEKAISLHKLCNINSLADAIMLDKLTREKLISEYKSAA